MLAPPRAHRRRLAAGLASLTMAFGILTLARQASAECPGRSVQVLPAEPAPLNTHVWVVVDNLAGPVTGEAKRKLLLKAGGESPPVKQHLLPYNVGELLAAAESPSYVVELVPQANLKPNTSYQVVVEDSGEVLGSVRTGTTEDRTEPRWAGIQSLVLRDGPLNSRRDEASAELTVGPATDETNTMLLAIWLGQEHTDPRSMVYLFRVGPQARRIDLNPYGECGRHNFAFPAADSPVKLIARVIDAAGNRSQPVEIDFVTPRPGAMVEDGKPRVYAAAGANDDPKGRRRTLVIVFALAIALGAVGYAAVDARS